MTCCTYLGETDRTEPTSDSELNSLLAQVRESTCEDWRIGEQVFDVRRWFRSPRKVYRYTLYNHVGGPEFQVISFYRPDLGNDSSINISNTAGHVAAFLYGLLAGLSKSHAAEQPTRQPDTH